MTEMSIVGEVKAINAGAGRDGVRRICVYIPRSVVRTIGIIPGNKLAIGQITNLGGNEGVTRGKNFRKKASASVAVVSPSVDVVAVAKEEPQKPKSMLTDVSQEEDSW